VVEHELAAFNPDLVRRPRLIVGSKLDAALPERQAELRTEAGRRGLPYLEISSATHRGTAELVRELRARLDEVDRARSAAEAESRRAGADRPAGGAPEGGAA